MFFPLHYALGFTLAAAGGAVDFLILLLLGVCVLSFSSGTELLKTSWEGGVDYIIIIVNDNVPIPPGYTLPLLPDPPAHTDTSQAQWCPGTRCPVT